MANTWRHVVSFVSHLLGARYGGRRGRGLRARRGGARRRSAQQRARWEAFQRREEEAHAALETPPAPRDGPRLPPRRRPSTGSAGAESPQGPPRTRPRKRRAPTPPTPRAPRRAAPSPLPLPLPLLPPRRSAPGGVPNLFLRRGRRGALLPVPVPRDDAPTSTSRAWTGGASRARGAGTRRGAGATSAGSSTSSAEAVGRRRWSPPASPRSRRSPRSPPRSSSPASPRA